MFDFSNQIDSSKRFGKENNLPFEKSKNIGHKSKNSIINYSSSSSSSSAQTSFIKSKTRVNSTICKNTLINRNLEIIIKDENLIDGEKLTLILKLKKKDWEHSKSK